MPVYTVKSLQDPTDLKYITNIGRVPRFIQEAAHESKLLSGTKVPLALVDSVAAFGLAELWPSLKTPTISEKRKRRYPIPFHPLLGMS